MSSPPRPGQARRQQVIDVLCEAFAHDEMELEDFERRVDAVHRADTAAELDRLLSGLTPRPLPATTGPGSLPAPAGAPTPPVAHAREREAVVGVMGGGLRRGRWTPARRITALAIMGGVELDFRDALLPPGVTEVHAFAFWGGVQVLAPPDVLVECSGVGIMGGFDHREESGEARTSASILRITGVALMGGVDVKVRRPGDSRRDARRRARELRLPPDDE